jgi:hypothetical protein
VARLDLANHLEPGVDGLPLNAGSDARW